MKKNKVLFLGMLALSVTFSACKKKKDPEPVKTETPPLTAAETDDFFQKTSASLKSDINETGNSEAVTKLEAISFVSSKIDAPNFQRVSADDYQGAFISLNSISPALLLKKLMITGPVSAVNARGASHETGFHFTENLGIYTWNNSTETWDKATSTNKIEINFPTDTNNLTVNDGKLSILNYEEVIIVREDGFNDTIPTSMIADFKVGAVKYASINYSGVFSADGLPTLVSLNGYLKPWNMVTKGEDKGTSANSSYSLYKDGEENSPITSTSFNITFEGGEKTKPVLGTGYVSYRNLKIEGAVKAKEIINSDETNIEPTEAEMNDWVNFDIKRSDNAKVADIIIKSNNGTTEPESPIMLQLTDGTFKTPETYFQSVIDEISALENN